MRMKKLKVKSFELDPRHTVLLYYSKKSTQAKHSDALLIDGSIPNLWRKR